MDKQGATISAKIWYIRQEAVIFFFFVYLIIICWVRLKKLKSGFFVVVSDMGLSGLAWVLHFCVLLYITRRVGSLRSVVGCFV